MADEQEISPLTKLYRVLTQTSKPVAMDRHYKYPIYAHQVGYNPAAVYLPKSTTSPEDSGVILNELSVPRSIRPDSSPDAINKFYSADGPEATLAHERVHHIDFGDDPTWKDRVDNEIGWTGMLRNLYSGLASRLYGHRGAETRAFVVSDSLPKDYFSREDATINLEPTSIGDLFSGRMKMSPDIRHHPLTDPRLLAELQQVMYKQLNAKGQAAMKSRQRK